MTLLTCAAVRRKMQAFHDRELPVRETIAIEAHVSTCPPCARDLRELRSIGASIRVAALPAPADNWAGMKSGVISRMRAEANESWAAKARRFVAEKERSRRRLGLHDVSLPRAASPALSLLECSYRFSSNVRYDYHTSSNLVYLYF